MEIFKVTGAILMSFGGAGVILFALSSWLGKVWASRILANEKQEHTKEIESYKHKLKVEISELQMMNDKSVYVSKTQYDKEFEIYLSIWESFVELRFATGSLYPQGLVHVPNDPDEKQEYLDDKYKKFSDAYDSFINQIYKFAPFYKEEFYDEFEEFRQICYRVFLLYKKYNYDKYNSLTYAAVKDTMNLTIKESNFVYDESHNLMKEKYEKLRINIHDYLISLQISQN